MIENNKKAFKIQFSQIWERNSDKKIDKIVTKASESVCLSDMISHLNCDWQLSFEHFDRLITIPESLHCRTQVAESSNLTVGIVELLWKSQIEFVIFEGVRDVPDVQVHVAQAGRGLGLARPIVQISEVKKWKCFFWFWR